MRYDLLSQVNESARADDEYVQLVERAIDILGFDRNEVICTESDLEKFLVRVSGRKLLEQREGAAMARAGEREWLADLARERETKDTEYQQPKKLGIPRETAKPAEGQRIVLPGRGGIGSIVALDLQHNQVMIRDKAGREFVVKMDELVGPKMVGKDATWMLKQ